MSKMIRVPIVLLLALLAACGGQTAATPTSAPAATDASVATMAVPAVTAAATMEAATSMPAITAAATMEAATSAPAATTMAAATSAATAEAAPTAATASGSGGELNVFAAASLTGAFKELGANFEKVNAGSKVTFNFAGSQQLAQQIGQGAPVDVFASANTSQMNVVIKSGQVISGTQRTFVRNRLVVVTPKDNPAGITTLKDLAKSGVKLVFAAKSVPVGGYALDFLGKASKLPEYTATYSPTVLGNVVSYETDVKAVLSKVSLGEADAGIVYTSDVTQDVAGKVTQIIIPDNLNVIATYPIATIKDTKNADLAQKFVTYVLSAEAQQILVKYGFIPTTGSASGAAPVAGPLAISGKVDKPLTLQPADMQKMTPEEVKATNRDGKEQTYKGVPISALLEMASVQSGATKVVFTGGDGYTAELTLADLRADPNAVIATDANGAFIDIIPTQKPRFWVKGLSKIEIA